MATQLGDLDAVAHDCSSSADVDRLPVETVQSSFPAHEHEPFVAHYRWLLAAWVEDAAARADARQTRPWQTGRAAIPCPLPGHPCRASSSWPVGPP